jgi:hypothetical protein
MIDLKTILDGLNIKDVELRREVVNVITTWSNRNSVPVNWMVDFTTDLWFTVFARDYALPITWEVSRTLQDRQRDRITSLIHKARK